MWYTQNVYIVSFISIGMMTMGMPLRTSELHKAHGSMYATNEDERERDATRVSNNVTTSKTDQNPMCDCRKKSELRRDAKKRKKTKNKIIDT